MEFDPDSAVFFAAISSLGSMTMRTFANLVAITVIVVVATRWPRRGAARPWTEALLLERHVKPVEFDSITLDAALSSLSRTWSIPIDVAADVQATARNQWVNDSIPAGTANQALSALLEKYELGFYAEKGRIHVASGNHVPTTVRIYDVRDLFHQMVAAYPAGENPRYPPPPQVGGSNISIFGGFAGPAPAPLPTRQAAIEEEQINRIEAMVMNFVTPDSWTDMGGSVGTIRSGEGWLIIAQTAESHRRIEALLMAIRRANRWQWERTFARKNP